MYGMETPRTRNFRQRRLTGALPRGLADGLKVGQPADSVLNTEAGEGSAPPPCDPLAFCAARGAAAARERRPRTPLPVR